MAREQWRSGEMLAWTEREGPGRGPSRPDRRVWLGVAGGLGLVLGGIMGSDTLCPEHRLWALGIGSAALIAAGTAIVGLIRGWVGAPLLALVAALGGLAIGLLDAAHSPARGRLIALGFGAVFIGSCWLVSRQERQRRWDREVAESLRAASIGAPPSDGADVLTDAGC